MSAGHTPGPWAVSKRGARRVTTTQGVVICNAVLRNSGSPKRGIKHGAKEVLEAEANARVIAAAPDGLDLAKDAIPILEAILDEREEEWGQEDEILRDLLNRTREFVTKATGQ